MIVDQKLVKNQFSNCIFQQFGYVNRKPENPLKVISPDVLRLAQLTRAIPQPNGFFLVIEDRCTVLTVVIPAFWRMKHL